MKIAQKFKDIEKPEELEPQAIEEYLRKLYNEPNYKVKDASYVEDAEPELVDGYRRRANILVDNLIRLTNNDKFEQLRVHFANHVLAGESRIIVDQLKQISEVICYKVEHNLINLPTRFKDELASAIIEACTPGALTNMQKVLYSMDESLYYQKYDYIQNLAGEHIREYRLTVPGNEIHKTNELIHEVSQVYKLNPPIDIYAIYRDLSKPPSVEQEANFRFVKDLEVYLSTRQAVYGLSQVIADRYLSNLPLPPKEGERIHAKVLDQDGSYTDSQELEKINFVAENLNFTLDSIIEYSKDGMYFTYKPDYVSCIAAAVINKLRSEEFIEYSPLTTQRSFIFEEPARYKFEKDSEGKLKKIYIPASTKKLQRI
jgi:hypothetical protein